ncbi:MarR family [Thermoplasmatales archaeon BRNA1]|nr:MarR family [Thermoplasmatales archaeon BRNA1]
MRAPLTEKQLCHLLGVDKANTSRAVMAMLEAGIIKKGRKVSGRSYEFELTEKGHEIGNIILARIYSELLKITSGIPDEEMLAFLSVMEKICIASQEDLEIAEIIAQLKLVVGRKVREEIVPNL